MSHDTLTLYPICIILQSYGNFTRKLKYGYLSITSLSLPSLNMHPFIIGDDRLPSVSIFPGGSNFHIMSSWQDDIQIRSLAESLAWFKESFFLSLTPRGHIGSTQRLMALILLRT